MAKPLTFRQLAKNFQAQSDLYSRLAKLQNQAAKDLPQDNTQPPDVITVAIVAYDKAVRSYYTSDGLQQQADAANAAADAAGETA